jgi:hypothetical protein
MGAPNVLLKLDGNTILAAGNERMVIPEGGAHVRVAAVQIPMHFTERPAVTATVTARSGPGVVGTIFGIFNIKVVELNQNATQVVIQATNVNKGQPIEGEFGCDYTIVGDVA